MLSILMFQLFPWRFIDSDVPQQEVVVSLKLKETLPDAIATEKANTETVKKLKNTHVVFSYAHLHYFSNCFKSITSRASSTPAFNVINSLDSEMNAL